MATVLRERIRQAVLDSAAMQGGNEGVGVRVWLDGDRVWVIYSRYLGVGGCDPPHSATVWHRDNGYGNTPHPVIVWREVEQKLRRIGVELVPPITCSCAHDHDWDGCWENIEDAITGETSADLVRNERDYH